eukprot:PhM_4_TR8451/c5_g1_i1/m.1383
MGRSLSRGHWALRRSCPASSATGVRGVEPGTTLRGGGRGGAERKPGDGDDEGDDDDDDCDGDGDDDDDDSPSNRNGGSNIINDSESVHYAWLDDSVSQRGVNTASTPTPVVTQRPAFPFAMPVPHQQQQQRGSPAPSPSAHQHHHQQFSTQNAHFHHHHFATVTPTVSPRRLHRMTPTVSREALDFL